MDECCVVAAELKFRERFPLWEPGIGGGYLYRNLLELAKYWGPITDSYTQMFTIRSVDEVELDTSAKILDIACANRHASHLIIVNERLYYFIWRVNLIVASYWKLDEHKAFIPKDSYQSWPTGDQLEQLSIAFDVYLGKRPLSDIGLEEFNALFFGSHPMAQMFYKFTVDVAELFVLLHECSHAAPLPDFKVQIELSPDLHFISPKRRERWLTEMRADANATYALFLAGFKFFENFGISTNDAKKAAAGTVFAGIDAALHTLLVLEELRFGDVQNERAATDPVWAKHPPANLRRNTWSFVSKAMAQMVLQASDWEEVRQSVGSMIYVRQQMFDKYLKSYGGRK